MKATPSKPPRTKPIQVRLHSTIRIWRYTVVFGPQPDDKPATTRSNRHFHCIFQRRHCDPWAVPRNRRTTRAPRRYILASHLHKHTAKNCNHLLWYVIDRSIPSVRVNPFRREETRRRTSAHRFHSETMSAWRHAEACRAVFITTDEKQKKNSCTTDRNR